MDSFVTLIELELQQVLALRRMIAWIKGRNAGERACWLITDQCSIRITHSYIPLYRIWTFLNKCSERYDCESHLLIVKIRVSDSRCLPELVSLGFTEQIYWGCVTVAICWRKPRPRATYASQQSMSCWPKQQHSLHMVTRPSCITNEVWVINLGILWSK